MSQPLVGALEVAGMAAGPLLLVAAVAGLAVALAQAVTSVQDQASAQLARLAALGLGLLVLGPYAFGLLVRFAAGLWSDLARFLT